MSSHSPRRRAHRTDTSDHSLTLPSDLFTYANSLVAPLPVLSTGIVKIKGSVMGLRMPSIYSPFVLCLGDALTSCERIDGGFDINRGHPGGPGRGPLGNSHTTATVS